MKVVLELLILAPEVPSFVVQKQSLLPNVPMFATKNMALHLLGGISDNLTTYVGVFFTEVSHTNMISNEHETLVTRVPTKQLTTTVHSKTSLASIRLKLSKVGLKLMPDNTDLPVSLNCYCCTLAIN